MRITSLAVLAGLFCSAALPDPADGSVAVGTSAISQVPPRGTVSLNRNGATGATGEVSAAASATELVAGETAAGRLEASDPIREDGTRYDAYRYVGHGGERIAVTMRSAEFDTYLQLLREVDGELIIVHEDDDGAGATDARMTLALPEDGAYLIHAGALFEDGFGNYDINVETGVELGSTIAEVLDGAHMYPLVRIGDTLQGTFAAGAPRLDDQSPYQAWSIDAVAGEAIEIGMTAEEFDAYLQIGRAGAVETLKVDDDGGDGTNARLAYDVPEDGRYVIVANSFGAAAEGDFSLTVGRARPTVSGDAMLRDWLPGAPRLRLGEPVTGTLDERSPLMDDRSYFQIYSFQGTAGQRITVTLRSDDFDAYLGLLRTDGAESPLWRQDDDSAGGTDSRITVEIPADGVYGIVANTLFALTTGSYTIEVTEGDAEEAVMTVDEIFSPGFAAAAHPVRAGQTVTGILDAASPVMEDGSAIQLWRYSARAGERITLTLQSEDFDTYLQAGFVNDASSRQSNDDGVDGSTDSRITLEVDRNGELVIVANSFSGGSHGTYTLTVERN